MFNPDERKPEYVSPRLHRNPNPTLELERAYVIERLDKFVGEHMDEMRRLHGDQPAIADKLAHIDGVTRIVRQIAPGDQLAELAARYHDIGRFSQFEQLEKFDDRTLLHHLFGEQFFVQLMNKGGELHDIAQTAELSTIRDVVMYHGRMDYLPFVEHLPERVRDIISIVSRADDIENGCIGAVQYLPREVETDAKNYKRDFPDKDMTSVSPSVAECFEKGEKFNKLELCKTYADYILFAAVLAVQSCKGPDGDLAKTALQMPYDGGQRTPLGEYERIFHKYVQEPEKYFGIFKKNCGLT